MLSDEFSSAFKYVTASVLPQLAADVVGGEVIVGITTFLECWVFHSVCYWREFNGSCWLGSTEFAVQLDGGQRHEDRRQDCRNQKNGQEFFHGESGI